MVQQIMLHYGWQLLVVVNSDLKFYEATILIWWIVRIDTIDDGWLCLGHQPMWFKLAGKQQRFWKTYQVRILIDESITVGWFFADGMAAPSNPNNEYVLWMFITHKCDHKPTDVCHFTSRFDDCDFQLEMIQPINMSGYSTNPRVPHGWEVRFAVQ